MSPVPSSPLRQLLSALDRLDDVDEPARSLAKSMARVCVDEGREVTANALMKAAQETLGEPHASLDSDAPIQFPANRPITLRAWRRARCWWGTLRVLGLLCAGGLVFDVVYQVGVHSSFSVMGGLVDGAGLLGACAAWVSASREFRALDSMVSERTRLGWAKYWPEGGFMRAYLEKVERCEMNLLLRMDVETLARGGKPGR